MNAPTLVTGVTGFVGSAVVRQLLEQGHSIRALVRSNSDCRNLDSLPIEYVTGDLSNPKTLLPAVTGCRFLFHVAADYRLWVPNAEHMYQCNVAGTRALMEAALAADVERIVYTSSVATLGLHKNGTAADETTPSSLADMIGVYKRSKFLAEQQVQSLIKEKGLPAVIVNPSTPMGAGDIKPTPTGRIILDTIRKRMPAYVDTGLNIVHVEDVAHGHILALQKGTIGRRYILGGTNMTLQEILIEICRQYELSPPRIKLPHSAILPIAWCMERISSLTGKEPAATVDGVRMSKKKMFFSSERAKNELGYHWRSATEAIADAIGWFDKNNYR